MLISASRQQIKTYQKRKLQLAAAGFGRKGDDAGDAELRLLTVNTSSRPRRISRLQPYTGNILPASVTYWHKGFREVLKLTILSSNGRSNVPDPVLRGCQSCATVDAVNGTERLDH